MPARHSALSGVVLFLLAAASSGQVDVRDADADMYPADTGYDLAIPTPAQFLGHELGHEPVRHHQLVDYITRVAEKSERLSLEVIGYSHERRPILFLIATSPENHARLDTIRAQHAALSEPGRDQPILDDMPGITWINFGVHGAEASGMDASLPFVYHLAAARGDKIERILSESVILVTAIFNPDGHSQRVAWLDAYGGQRRISDPAHIEHQSSWQFARTNHYWFDLNRQWLLLTQPEPRAWMRKWHEWRPNLTVDYHMSADREMLAFDLGLPPPDATWPRELRVTLVSRNDGYTQHLRASRVDERNYETPVETLVPGAHEVMLQAEGSALSLRGTWAYPAPVWKLRDNE